jgi:hypothetical protein
MQNTVILSYENKFRICNQQNIFMNKGFDKIYNLQSGGNQFQLSIKSIAFGYMKNTRLHAFCMMMKARNETVSHIKSSYQLLKSSISSLQVDAGLNFNPRACLIVSLLRLIDWWCLRCAR